MQSRNYENKLFNYTDLVSSSTSLLGFMVCNTLTPVELIRTVCIFLGNARRRLRPKGCESVDIILPVGERGLAFVLDTGMPLNARCCRSWLEGEIVKFEVMRFAGLDAST
jgi:hypothetical protein